MHDGLCLFFVRAGIIINFDKSTNVTCKVIQELQVQNNMLHA